MIDLSQIRSARQESLQQHRNWKASIRIADQVAADEWEVIWPDGVGESADPLVENLYTQALEDKIAAAGSMLPHLFVSPTRGTRADRGEQNAAKRQRVMASYWSPWRANLKKNLKSYYSDWFHAGAVYTLPWTEWADRESRPFPYFIRLDPRTVFPLGHDSRDNLTSALVMRQRRVADLVSDWGEAEAIGNMRKHRAYRAMADAEFLEEIWYFDGTDWAVAVGDSMLPAGMQGYEWVSRDLTPQGGVAMEWLKAPEKHGLFGCPVTEAKRVTHDGRYRGALVDIIPQLKTAQNFMARLLDDLNSNIYAPVVLDNIENPEEYGPGAILVGTGNGAARIEHSRPPVNFEARQAVADILAMARKQAFEPEQRAGEAGASIVSGKGTMALMGSFNAELAWAQGDIESLLERTTSITANFDEVWCPGEKVIEGWDNEAYVEKYDPAKLFAGDYRCHVTYGERTGLDENSHMSRLGLVRQLGGISLRTFMEKAGISEDPLQEEREITIEKLTSLFLDQVLPQSIQGGDLAALKAFVDKIDTDKVTVRGAVLDTIREMSAPPPGEAGAGPGGGGGPADVMKMMRSMAFGGVPGRAEGLPLPGKDLQQVLPPSARRAMAESAPGGTATPDL